MSRLQKPKRKKGNQDNCTEQDVFHAEKPQNIDHSLRSEVVVEKRQTNGYEIALLNGYGGLSVKKKSNA